MDPSTHYHSGMTVEEAIDLVDKCKVEIRLRLVVTPPNFVIKTVEKDEAREYASVKDAAVASAQRYLSWTRTSIMII
ncbi:hypothetical protein V6N11_060956 [Hibiscus sabdariffa]|uniref:Uncharacterized protein n=1 Tax=Hibiscus sabdariffa TaxID=183260 RepID=A0ABR2QRV2_9ROSI